MGYTTEFSGKFKTDVPVDEETYNLMVGIATTRRMKRNLEGYGIEGEFYICPSGGYGQTRTTDIVDYNRPPSNQPGLWCVWLMQEDKQTIMWDEGEKFYHYIEWIEYLINKVLAPKGYKVSGQVQWRGENWDDNGTIAILENEVSVET